jgi:hypothetical protein
VHSGGQEKGERLMEIMVDEKKIESEGWRVKNLEEVLLNIMADKMNPNKVITTVKLNGNPYSEKTPHDAAKIMTSEIQKLEVETMSTEEIAWHFLIKSGEHLGQMIENAQWVSELFRVADANDANEQYARFLEGLQQFLKMVNEVKAILNFNLREIPFQNGTIETRIEKLSGLMDQMIRVQEEEDWVMLADFLEYELIPLLEEWKSILTLLKEKREN